MAPLSQRPCELRRLRLMRALLKSADPLVAPRIIVLPDGLGGFGETSYKLICSLSIWA